MVSFSHLDIGNVRFKCARFCRKAIIGTIVIAGSDFRKVVPFCPLVSCNNRLVKFSSHISSSLCQCYFAMLRISCSFNSITFKPQDQWAAALQTLELSLEEVTHIRFSKVFIVILNEIFNTL